MDKEFREFEIKDIFQTNPFGDGLQVPTGSSIPSRVLEVGLTPRISVKSVNNGVIGYYKDVDSNNYRTYENCISVSFLGTVFYHPYKASFDMKVHCLKPINRELRRGEALYLVSCIKKLVENNTYGNQTSSTDLPYMKISLPVTENNEPDWEYMEKRVAVLEELRVAEMAAYLEETGLSDYILTDEDLEILSCFGSNEEHDGEDSLKIWEEFKIVDIATVEYGNKFDKNKMSYQNPSVNFVSRTATNNGVSDFVDNNGTDPYKEGLITLALGGSIGSCFLQEQPFYTGQNVGVIDLGDIDYRAKIFFTEALGYKCKRSFNAFSNEINKHLKTTLSVMLPIQTDEQNNPIIDPDKTYHPEGYIPDWDFMEHYIRAIEKVVIADVVKYKDEVIETTKEVGG